MRHTLNGPNIYKNTPIALYSGVTLAGRLIRFQIPGLTLMHAAFFGERTNSQEQHSPLIVSFPLCFLIPVSILPWAFSSRFAQHLSHCWNLIFTQAALLTPVERADYPHFSILAAVEWKSCAYNAPRAAQLYNYAHRPLCCIQVLLPPRSTGVSKTITKNTLNADVFCDT